MQGYPQTVYFGWRKSAHNGLRAYKPTLPKFTTFRCFYTA